MNVVMLCVFYKDRDYPLQFDMKDAATGERILQSIATKLETQSIVTFAFGEYNENVAMITKDNLVFIKLIVPLGVDNKEPVFPKFEGTVNP